MMAMHSTAETYGWILERLAEALPDGRAKGLALKVWRRLEEQGITPAAVGADEALLRLGLAKKGKDGRVQYPTRKARAFYFGVWTSEAGHYLRGPDGRLANASELPLALRVAKLDGHFCPPVDGPGERQPEGLAAIHHVDGWTVLSFWDRSADARYGSHSTYLLEGHLGFEDAAELAREAFPGIWGRYSFPVGKHPLA